MFVIDTNVISAARRPDRSGPLAAWLKAQNEADLYLSVITVGEINRGIRKQERVDPFFAEDLKLWLQETLTMFHDRILPFTADDAQIWGRLSFDLGHSGADLMIAASALSRGATVVTRNISDFEQTGVALLDPF